MEDLNGKVALVTSSSRVIGRAIGIALAEAGADVVVNCVRQVTEAQKVESQIRGTERRCVSIQADIALSSDVRRLVRESEDRVGPIDVRIKNAGVVVH